MSLAQSLRSRITRTLAGTVPPPRAGPAGAVLVGPEPGDRHPAVTPERLERAIAADQLHLLYLPRIDVPSRRTVAAEALLRWRLGPDRFVAPGAFVPLAEESGLLGPLTRWVLRHAIDQLGRWRALALDLGVSVSLRAAELDDADLVADLGSELSRAGVEPDRLSLEIAETALLPDPGRALERLRSLRGLGVGLVLDDFSTACDSPPGLCELPLAGLKIDREFVMGMPRLSAYARVVHESVGLAHRLGLRVIAAGVYSRKVWELLAASGCDEAQGFYLSAPQSEAEMTRWLQTSTWGAPPGAGATARAPRASPRLSKTYRGA